LLWVGGAVAAVAAAHVWFDTQRLRSRWRDLQVPPEPDPTACDPRAVTDWIAKHRKGKP